MDDNNMYAINSEHQVQVTHINNPLSFYVRLSCLRYTVQILENRGGSMNFAEALIGRVVVYKSKTLKRYCRGRIKKRARACGIGEFCKIFAIDYGCVDNRVPLKNMYLPNATGSKCVPLAVHCQLYQCDQLFDTFDTILVRAMKLYVAKYSTKIVVRYKSAEKLTVELRTMEGDIDISAKLSELQYTNLVGRPTSPLNAEATPLKYRHVTFKAGDQFRVRVQSGTSIFEMYVAEITHFHNYNDVIEWYRFTKYCMGQHSCDVDRAATTGQACGVRVNGPKRYERAVITGISEPSKKAVVQLVDWGTEQEVLYEHIKPVASPRFLSRPALAIYCTADRLQAHDQDLGQGMIYPGLEFYIEILEPGDGFRVPHRVFVYPAMANMNLRVRRAIQF